MDSDKVDGFHANEIARVGGLQVTADVDNWNGGAITDSVAITAPRAGYLLINYSFNAAQDASETSSAIGYLNFNPRLNGATIGDTAYEAIDYAAPNPSDYVAAPVNRTVAVAAGNHTVSVVATGPGGGAATTQLVYVFERSLQVTFVPFNGAGAAAAAASSASNSGSSSSANGQ